MQKKRTFITGGASGLGQALALRYARDGHRVCVGDLDEARCAATLEGIRRAGGEGHALACDVTKEEDLERAAAWLEQAWGGVDVVFNNAGVAQAGGIADVPMSDWQWIVDVNLLGVVRGCKVFTKYMRKQGHGHIVNTASMAGLIHIPRASAYNATKAAVIALSETLKLELEPDNIAVSVVCPAFFRTNLSKTMRATDPELEQIVKKLVEKAKVSADTIADHVYRAVERREFRILTHTDAKIVWLLKRVAPFSVYLAAMRRGAERRVRRRADQAVAPGT